MTVNTTPPVVDGEVIDVQEENRGWTSPDWLTPRLYRNTRRAMHASLLFLALSITGAISEIETPSNIAAVAFADMVTEQYAADVEDQGGIVWVAVRADRVSGRMWVDMINDGWEGRAHGNDWIIYVPDTDLDEYAYTAADQRYAEKWGR